jgi:hypothetical protein
MDQRVLFAVIFGLVLLAFGGFYFALSTHYPETAVSPAPTIGAPPAPQAAAPPRDESRVIQSPAVPVPNAPASAPQAPTTAPAPAASIPAAPAPPVMAPEVPATPAPAAVMPVPAPLPGQPVKATPASVEAEIAQSDYADLQALLKANFADEYASVIAGAVGLRNNNVPDGQFDEMLSSWLQDMLRPKLKYGVGASMLTIDRLAANEAALFHALGVEAAPNCMKMLGRDPGDTGPLPDNVNHLMRLGTLYRFQTIIEGMAHPATVEPMTNDERSSFEAALSHEGLRMAEVSSGAFLTRVEGAPGQPCLAMERLHRAIASLAEATRRKIYAGMFFLGRDK